MSQLDKQQMFDNLSQLSLDDLRVVEEMVRFHLLRVRSEAPLGVDVSAYNFKLPSGYKSVFAGCVNCEVRDSDAQEWPELGDIKTGFSIKKSLSSGMPGHV